MSVLQIELAVRAPELVLGSQATNGRYVVKNTRTGGYFTLGETEHFLLTQLDGVQSADDICQAFERRFQEPLSADDLAEFLDLARAHHFLREPESGPPGKSQASPETPDEFNGLDSSSTTSHRQSIFYFRVSLFDPDRLLSWLVRPLGFLWTKSFLVLSLLGIAAAGVVLWTGQHELVVSLATTLRWETLLLVWGLVVITTMCHEFAHGLTCKRFGGEVHEIGVLVMLFTPCLYCNVTDAWMIPERSKRLWITLAGSYCDLCLGAVAVFVWRLTALDSLTNYMAAVVLSVSGARISMNVNPLLRLDGYYLLSDLLDQPNLRQNGQRQWMELLRWLLWGSRRSELTPSLVAYGLASWLFLFFFMGLLLIGLYRFIGTSWGVLAALPSLYIGQLVTRSMFHGFSKGEISIMLRKRPVRLTIWILVLSGVVGATFSISMPDRVGGTFQVRPGTRAEIRAPVAGFLREVHADEGEHVSAGLAIGRLEVPDLTSLLAQKQAGIRESQANLRRLEAGPRPEEVEEQRLRVERLIQWREQGEQDVVRARRGLSEELGRLDLEIKQVRSELDFARETTGQAEELYRKGALAGKQLQSETKKRQVLESQWQQVQAQKRAREAAGTMEFDAELGRREQELADAKSRLSLQQAGGRPEEIDAERARLARLQEELSYLEALGQRQAVVCPVVGLVITPRMKELIGRHFEKGELICTVEDMSKLEVAICVSEQDVLGVEPGQPIVLKARALPFRTFEAQVDRVAPAVAVPQPSRSCTLNVYCKVANPDGALRSGMTGYGRIRRGADSPGKLALRQALQFLRTEFWW